jgi:PAS domain S-box-containing protein
MTFTLSNGFGTQSPQAAELLEGLLAPLCIYNEQGKTLYASQKLLHLLQLAPEKLDFFSYFRSQTTGLHELQHYWHRARQGETVTFVCSIHALRIRIQCRLQHLPQEHCWTLWIDLIDSTCRPHLPQQYERSILSLLEHTGTAIALADPTGQVFHYNQRFSDLLKVSTHESLNLYSLIHVDDQHLDDDLKQRLLNQDIHSYTVEKRLITAHHDILWVNLSVSRLEVPDPETGNKIYLAISLEDLTEQHKLYEALIRTEEKWKTFVLNSAHLFLQISDIGRILYVSPAVERTLGYSEEELLDRSIIDLIHTYDLQEFKLAFNQWLSGINSPQTNLECRWQAKSGQWMYLYVQGQRFPLALGMEGIALSGYNISDRKHLEVELQASEKKLKSLAADRCWKSVSGRSDNTDYLNIYHN